MALRKSKSFVLGLIIASVISMFGVFYLYLSILSNGNGSNNNFIPTSTNKKLDEIVILNSNYLSSKNNKDKNDKYISLKNRFGKGSSHQSIPKWKQSFNDLIRDFNSFKNEDKLVQSLKNKVIYAGGDNLGIIRNQEDRRIHDEGFKKHAFNVLISERLGISRDIPDTRHDSCKSKVYEDTLPQASVIICFYNEEFNALIRTIHSVLERSRNQDLHEILLVDDSSNLDNLNEKIREYVKRLPSKVILLKTPKNEGLIRARIFGARHASGDVLVFLDSHVEAQVNWLEPLLTAVEKDKKSVVTPIIDVINPETFLYTSSPLVKGGFNWGLHFKWDNIPVNISTYDFTKPIDSPTMAGGLFAMDANYFKALGEYDDGMTVWGGENLELSFRVWMCGGNIKILPCSRVGHVFRRRRPYGSKPGEVDSVLRNSARLANVWMDEYKENYFKEVPSSRNVDYGNVKDRVELRKKLNCTSFKWYLDNVYPDIISKSSAASNAKFVPWNRRKKNYKKFFKINLSNTNLCLRGKEYLKKGSKISVGSCSDTSKSFRWGLTVKNELILAETYCLEAGSKGPMLGKCHEELGNQDWQIGSDNESPIYNLATGLCLGIPNSNPVENESSFYAIAVLNICSDSDTNFKFDLIPL